MADAAVAIQPDSTGKLIDLASLTNGSAQTVYRQTTTLGDPVDITAVQTVRPGSSLPTAADGAAVVIVRPDNGGSAGQDFSQNQPSWPNIAANFGAGGLYPSWVFLAGVSANPSRLKITVDNMSTGQILVLRDDGTAPIGSSPNNATGFTLNPKVSVGPEGGHYESTTFRGRLQVFGASISQFVAISTD